MCNDKSCTTNISEEKIEMEIFKDNIQYRIDKLRHFVGTTIGKEISDKPLRVEIRESGMEYKTKSQLNIK